MGYLSTPTRVGALDSDGNRTFESGSVKLDAGVGLAFTRNIHGAIQLDAQNIAPGAPSGVFLPGALVPYAERLRMGMNTSDGAGYLSLLEACADTASIGATLTDGTILRVRGSVSGSQDLRLTADIRRTFWSGMTTIPVGYRAYGGINYSGQGHFISSNYKATAEMIVKAVSINLYVNEVAPRFCIYILNEARDTILAQSLPQETSALVDAAFPGSPGDDAGGFAANRFTVPLITAVTLLTDESFWVCVGFLGTVQQISAGPYRYNWDPGWGGGLTAGAVEGSNTSATLTGPLTYSSPSTLIMALSGSPGGVRIAGDVILDVIAIGSGPTTPPADINVRLVFAGNQP